MPKDRAEVQDQYKIGGGSLNEYEFNRGKGEFEEQENQTPEGGHAEGLRGADEPNAPQNVAGRIRQVGRRAQEIAERRRAKASGGAASKAGASKSAGKKAGGLKGAAPKASKKGVGKKGVAKKGAPKKGGATKRGLVKEGAVDKSSARRRAGGR